MKGGRTILIVLAAFLVGALAVAGIGTALAWGPGPGGQGWGPFGGMMGASGPGGMMGGGMMGSGRMMGGGSYAGSGMMGSLAGQRPSNQGEPVNLDKAVEAVKTYVERTGNQDLAVDEVMEFQNNFYAIVKEKSTGTGALELLVDKYSGNVLPEFGPNMMWNTKYGMMGGQNGGGMMGGMMGGQYLTTPTTQPTVTPEQAQKVAQDWLNQYQPGLTTEQPDQFYGYHTVHTLKDGKVTGMLSVNGFTGQVWYHNWHGGFVQQKELEQ